jgi:thiamine-phosphate pyrophosphorylase
LVSVGAPVFELYLIADALPRDAIASAVERALAASPRGRVAVQLRYKELPTSARRALAEQLRTCTRAMGAPLLINGDLALARSVGADGVHLPSHGHETAAVRAALGPSALLGVSCHDRDSLAAAACAGADFATLSPVFAVPDKGAGMGVDGFAHHCAGAGLPVFALGGIAPRTIPALCAAGAGGVAVIRAVLAVDDPGSAAAAVIEALDRARAAKPEP